MRYYYFTSYSYLGKHWLWCMILVFISVPMAYAHQDTSMKRVEGRKNSLKAMEAPYVIMISVDGFRHDYVRTCHTPTLDSLEKTGIRAKYMIPCFPAVTFPNHYSIATGMYPAHHGIVCNRFFDMQRQQKYAMASPTEKDSFWYKGKPIWTLAEENKMLSATVFWVGSDAQQSVPPTYSYSYHNKFSPKEQVNKAVQWLRLPDSVRPHLIMLYFFELDEKGHHTGTQSKETRREVERMDSMISYLVASVKQTGLDNVHFILLSDHGMINIDKTSPIPEPTYDKKDFVVINSKSMMAFYAQDKHAVLPLYDSLCMHPDDRYKVYLKKDMPTHLHSGVKDDKYQRIGDILLLAKAPYVFYNDVLLAGTHGYDPRLTPEMNTIFYAWGPSFRKNLILPPFENVNVFPIVTQLLGLPLPANVDGNTDIARQIIKQPTIVKPKRK